LSSGNLETDEDGADVSLLIIISILNFSWWVLQEDCITEGKRT